MMRWDVINTIMKKYDLKSYLEIGVQDANCNFAKIQAERKVSVDPAPRNYCDFVMTSDQYFDQLDPKETFQFCFIDGLHHDYQVERDVLNCLNHLEEGGFIMCHDCLPENESQQTRHIPEGAWTGDCWKAWVKLRCTRPDLFMTVINTDWGCGIIRPGSQILYNNGVVPAKLDWNYFSNSNVFEMMNVVSPEYIDNI